MFNLFTKKKARASGPQKILVPHAALQPGADDYALTMGVVTYVNAMQSHALYRRDELPAEALWLYHSDYYLAQINNGGHSQFIHNSGMSEFIFSDIRNGLELIGATEMAACFAEMSAWISANPAQAALQNGFGERAPELDELDKRVYGLVDTEGHFYAAANRWLKASDKVDAIPEGQNQAVFDAAAQANPDYAARKRIQHINQLQHGLTADFLGLFRTAGANKFLGEKPLEVQRLTAGFPVGHPTEEGGTIWGVATSIGVLAGYVTKDTVVLTDTGTENGFSVGQTKVAECPLAPAQDSVTFAQEMQVAGCAVELLAKVNRTAQFRYIGPMGHSLTRDKKGNETGAYLGVTEDDKIFTIVVTRKDAAIAPYPPASAMARLGARDIARLKTEIDAHNSYVPT